MSRRISFRPLIFLVLCLLVVMYLARTMSRQGDITYSAMRENFVQEKVQSFTVSDSRLTATLKDQTTVTCPIRDFTLFYDDLNDLVVEQYSKGIITQYDYPAAPGTNWLQVLLPYVLAIMAFILLMNLMTRMNGSGAAASATRWPTLARPVSAAFPRATRRSPSRTWRARTRKKRNCRKLRGIPPRPGEVPEAGRSHPPRECCWWVLPGTR